MRRIGLCIVAAIIGTAALHAATPAGESLGHGALGAVVVFDGAGEGGTA